MRLSRANLLGIFARLWIFAFALFIMVAAFASRAEDASSIFESANKLYDQGKFSAAASKYDELLATGNVSAALYFNRGTALFKLGQTGRAIASYRQAQLLAPRDADIRTNLQFARTRARGGSTYRSERWHTLLQSLSLNEWTLLTAAALWVFFILLALGQWRSDLRPSLRNGILMSALATICLGACLGVTVYLDDYASPAIVIAGEAEVRNGPLDEAPGIFKVRDGAELSVVDQKDGWLQVVDSADRTGWLRHEEVLMFEPAAARKAKS